MYQSGLKCSQSWQQEAEAPKNTTLALRAQKPVSSALLCTACVTNDKPFSLLNAISSFAKSKNKMLVWQITDYIFTAAANLLLGGYTSALTISISIIRNRLMIKKKMTKTILSILIILRTIVGSLSQSTWGYWLFANHLFSLL